jgi:hypothetical protein
VRRVIATELVTTVEKNQETILRMNELLNHMIANEVGVNDGQFLVSIIAPK